MHRERVLGRVLVTRTGRVHLWYLYALPYYVCYRFACFLCDYNLCKQCVQRMDYEREKQRRTPGSWSAA